MSSDISNEIVYRRALEDIRDFAHSMHMHPHIEHEAKFHNGSAMEEIAFCARLALAEVQS